MAITNHPNPQKPASEPSKPPSNDSRLAAKVGLASAIIAALAAVVGPIYLHSLDSKSQAANAQQTAYGNFITQADTTEAVLNWAYLSAAAAKRTTPSQRRESVLRFSQLINASIGQLAAANGRLTLVAPKRIANAAASVANSITAMEKDEVSFIQDPDKGTEAQLGLGSMGYASAKKHFQDIARIQN